MADKGAAKDPARDAKLTRHSSDVEDEEKTRQLMQKARETDLSDIFELNVCYLAGELGWEALRCERDVDTTNQARARMDFQCLCFCRDNCQ